MCRLCLQFFFFSSRRRHTRSLCDWSSDVCSYDLDVQLELNVMMPVIAHNLLFTMAILANATRVFAERCVEGIEADAAQCEHWLERSPALVTALAPKIGYAEAAKLAKEAVAKNMTVRQLVMEKGILKGKDLEEVLDLAAMTEIGVPGRRKK